MAAVRCSRERTADAFVAARSLHPLVVGHMCKQGKRSLTFARRFFALYDGGLLAYYDHERDFKKDVRRHDGVPLNCKLVKLDGVYVTRPSTPPHGIKHCFILHTPEQSNHRNEFLLVCQKKKDMHIWMEHFKSQNSELVKEEAKKHKIYPHIAKMRLQNIGCVPVSRKSISELDSKWLRSDCCTGRPGEIALTFYHDPVTKPELHKET